MRQRWIPLLVLGLCLPVVLGADYIAQRVERLLDRIIFTDSAYLSFGTSEDVTINWDATDLHVTAAANNSMINVGNGTTSFDVRWYGSSASNFWYWDASANLLSLPGNLQVQGSVTVEGASTFDGAVATSGAAVTIGQNGSPFKEVIVTSGTIAQYATSGTVTLASGWLSTNTYPMISLNYAANCTSAVSHVIGMQAAVGKLAAVVPTAPNVAVTFRVVAYRR